MQLRWDSPQPEGGEEGEGATPGGEDGVPERGPPRGRHSSRLNAAADRLTSRQDRLLTRYSRRVQAPQIVYFIGNHR